MQRHQPGLGKFCEGFDRRQRFTSGMALAVSADNELSPNPTMSFQRFSLKLISVVTLMVWLFFAVASSVAADQKPPADAQSAGTDAGTKGNKPKPDAGAEGFVFGGGNLRGFIEQVKRHFGVDLFDVATIEIPVTTRVPKMRVTRQPGNEHYPHLRDVLEAYNSLSDHGLPRLGKWHMAGGSIDRPDIVTLTGENSWSRAAITLKLRAFSIKGLSSEEREKLIRTVGEATEHLSHEWTRFSEIPEMEEPTITGNLRINESTDLLLATGSETYLEVVEEVIREYRSQRHTAPPDPFPSKTQKTQESDFTKP